MMSHIGRRGFFATLLAPLVAKALPMGPEPIYTRLEELPKADRVGQYIWGSNTMSPSPRTRFRLASTIPVLHEPRPFVSLDLNASPADEFEWDSLGMPVMRASTPEGRG